MFIVEEAGIVVLTFGNRHTRTGHEIPKGHWAMQGPCQPGLSHLVGEQDQPRAGDQLQVGVQTIK